MCFEHRGQTLANFDPQCLCIHLGGNTESILKPMGNLHYYSIMKCVFELQTSKVKPKIYAHTLQAVCVLVQYKLLPSSSSLVCLLQICSSVFHEGPWRPCSTLIWPRPPQTYCFPTAYLAFSCPFSQTGENLRKLNSSDFGRGYLRLQMLFCVLPAQSLMGGVLFFSSDPHGFSAISCTIYLLFFFSSNRQ